MKISMKRLLSCVIITVFFASIAQDKAYAAAGPWQGNGEMQARIITATDSTGGLENIQAGLEVKLKSGWKIYWRSPGDAGLPPELDFGQSPDIIASKLSFPAPSRFDILGFESFGYSDHVIFPLQLTLAKKGQGFTAAPELSGLICSTICIPINERLTISLPKGTGKVASEAAPEARIIAKFKSQVPRKSNATGARLKSLSITRDYLYVAFEKNGTPIDFVSGDVLIEAASGLSFAAPVSVNGKAQIAVSGQDSANLIGEKVTVTAITPDWVFEASAIVTEQKTLLSPFIALVGIAILGGFILNFMPCVLPVLSLKLASILGKGGGELRLIRRSFIATAFGVIGSFIMLGGALLALRMMGGSIGWGIQFQQPIFLIIAAAVMAGFGLVMLDVVSIPVPKFAQKIGHKKGGIGGDILTGAMATVLATPCSAPFVGTAVAFAVTTSPAKMMAIFAAMGTGLALPWIAIALRPKMITLLPKPGAWFKRLKQILAAGLFITAFWLVTILVGISSSGNDGKWQRWQPELAQAAAEKGQIVFVDVTADWCITCKANKAIVLNSAAIQAQFAAQNVLLLKADWTKPDPQISQFLASFNRYGIPFNVVYGPRAKGGIILPELLTQASVTKALEKAASK